MNKKTIIIIISAVIVSGGLGFFAGNKLGDHNTPKRDWNELGGNFQVNRGTNTGGQVGVAIGNTKGGMVSGEILSVDGQTITVKTQNGGSKIVLLSDSLSVMKSVSGEKSDIKSGENVTVIGKTNTDGSVSAESIQIRSTASGK